MRLLATGDFHIGAGLDYGHGAYGPGSRLDDQRIVLERIAAVARDEKVDAILHAGDFFERRSPSPSEIEVFQSFLDCCEEIPVYAIDGNHCVRAADLPSTGWIFRDRLRISRKPEIIEIGPLSESVFVATLPWTPPARLVASQGGGDRDELNAQVADLLIETARGLRAQIPEGRTSILLGHWSVSGASTPTGMDVGLLREPVLPVGDLEEIGFDYVVLGHIHRRQLLGSENARGPLLYVGSPMCLNFGESREEHGVWIIDTDYTPSAATPVGYRFVPIEDRPFVTIDADLTEALPERGGVNESLSDHDGQQMSPLRSAGNDRLARSSASTSPPAESALDETDRITAAIAEHFPLTDAVVRLRYRATAEQARRVDHAALRGLLADAGVSKLYAIQPEIIRSDRARVEGVDEGVEPMQALDLWIEHNFPEVARGDELRTLTSRYLDEAAA